MFTLHSIVLVMRQTIFLFIKVNYIKITQILLKLYLFIIAYSNFCHSLHSNYIHLNSKNSYNGEALEHWPQGLHHVCYRLS